MTYWDDLVGDVGRRFEKVVREQDVLDALPASELSDGELAWQVARHGGPVVKASGKSAVKA